VVAVPFAVLAFALGWLLKEIPLRTTAFTPTTPDGGSDSEEGQAPGSEPDVPVEVVAL